MTGFAFAHGTVDDMTSPTRMPVHLLALKKPAKPVLASDSALRSAIVNVVNYYLRMAQTKSPAEMEAIIWGNDSVDGVDHGESCAAFASLTLALGAQATGQESWVTGGTTYPWPLHQWADVRVDPNPASLGVISVLQDAQAHHRWHPLGDGYQPQPGDWVMFDGHVEVVTRYSAGVLYTIGGDSSPNLSVNAHTFTGPLDAQGVAGFVNNGELLSAASPATSAAPAGGAATGGTATGGTATGGTATGGSAAGGPATAAETAGIQAQGQPAAVTASVGEAAVPGTRTAALTSSTGQMAGAGRTAGRGTATVPGSAHGRGTAARKGTARMVGTAGGMGYAGMQSMVTVPGVMAGAGMAAGDGATAGHGNSARAGSPARTASPCERARPGERGMRGERAVRGGPAPHPGPERDRGLARDSGRGPRPSRGYRRHPMVPPVVRPHRPRRPTPGTTRRPRPRMSRTRLVSRRSSVRSRPAPSRRKAGTASRRP